MGESSPLSATLHKHLLPMLRQLIVYHFAHIDEQFLGINYELSVLSCRQSDVIPALWQCTPCDNGCLMLSGVCLLGPDRLKEDIGIIKLVWY